MNKCILELNRVHKWFGNIENPQTVLKDISFKIYPGDMVAVRGRSGSGKSTLLNILAGTLSVNSGKVLYKGKDIYRISENERASYRRVNIGYIPQNLYLLNDRTVFDNIALPLQYMKMGKNKIKYKVDMLTGNMGIRELLNKEIASLSGGERQRIAICRAIIKEPEILFADEPTCFLDDENEKVALGLFLKLNREGTTIIISTHDDPVASVCNRELTLT